MLDKSRGWGYIATHIVEKNNRSEMLLIVRFSGKLFLPDRFDQSVHGTEALEGVRILE